MAHRAENIYYLALYRKSLATPDLKKGETWKTQNVQQSIVCSIFSGIYVDKAAIEIILTVGEKNLFHLIKFY